MTVVHAERREREIADDESMLEQVAGLLESGADLAAWPTDVRIALALALEDGSMSDTETWKAVTLRRHLFGPAGVVPEQIASIRDPSAAARSRKPPPTGCSRPIASIRDPSAAARRRAEGLRAGLPARVRYRVATYLLQAVR